MPRCWEYGLAHCKNPPCARHCAGHRGHWAKHNSLDSSLQEFAAWWGRQTLIRQPVYNYYIYGLGCRGKDREQGGCDESVPGTGSDMG